MNAFLAAAARWLGASDVRIVNAGDRLPPDDAAGAAAETWLTSGADPDGTPTVLDGFRLEFAAIDAAPEAVLLVRRPVRRPRPAALGERIAAVAALAGQLMAAARAPEDGETTGRERLSGAIRAARVATVFAVGMDRLGVVNEVCGREAGDTVVQALAERLAGWAGPDAVIARLSGTRFGVVRSDLADLDAAVAAAYKLRELLAAPVPVGDLPISRSVSVGVTVGGPAQAAELVSQAVRGSLAARESGGDAVRTYNRELADARIGRLRLELELDSALHTGQLRLFYQPEFDLRTGQLLAVEALLRWDHPRLGLVRAEAFVDDTERTRTFGAVQMWVIEEACRQLAAWQALHGTRRIGLRINVSAWQIGRGEIADGLLATIERHRLPPESVCVELTERRMPRRPETIADALTLLSSRGLTIAIDDFGTGQGTVSQLTTLPVDTIKIDQSFVTAMRTDPRADAVVAGIVALADSLSLETVAEGVDGADTAARLVQLGCTRGQGHSLGEPMPGDEVEGLLRR